METNEEGKRRRQRERYAADPQSFLDRKKSRYQTDPTYARGVMARTTERRRNNPSLYLWSKAKRRAKLENREFNIEVSDVAIPECCPVFGIKMEVLSGDGTAPTIDRIDSSKGYIKGNVAVISKRANSLKSDATPEELMILAKWFKRVSK